MTTKNNILVPCAAGTSGPNGGPCIDCRPGSFKATVGSNSCSDCAPGKFSSVLASSICEDCNANSDSAAGSTECTCIAGATLSLGGRRLLSTAAPGVGACTLCVAGKFKAERGSAGCTECSDGKYSAVVGASNSNTCVDCPVNSQSFAGSGAKSFCFCIAGASGPDGGPCSLCGAGKYKEIAGTGSCLECGAGKYSTAVGATSCQSCPPRSVSPPASASLKECVCNSGATGPDGGPCVDCAAGKYKVATGKSACVDCAAGTYSASVGASSQAVCKTCPVHSESSPGSVECVCVAGYTGSGGVCAACESGKHKVCSVLAAACDISKTYHTYHTLHSVCILLEFYCSRLLVRKYATCARLANTRLPQRQSSALSVHLTPILMRAAPPANVTRDTRALGAHALRARLASTRTM